MIENIMIGISFGTKYLRISWEDNIKIDLRDTIYDRVYWIWFDSGYVQTVLRIWLLIPKTIC
jgi:hypothetical protein